MNTTDTTTVLIGYVKQELMRGRNANLTEDTDLLGAGIIDSLGVLQLVAFVDERLGVQIPDEDVTYENFHSVRALASYLASNN
jgi:acyl carrier protein